MSTTAPTSNLSMAGIKLESSQVVSNSTSNNFVSVKTGGYELIMNTHHLSGVHQLSRRQAEASVDQLKSGSGDVSLVSLADVIEQRLGLPTQQDELERALIAVEYEGKKYTLRAASVSRPIEVEAEHRHSIPQIAHPRDTEGLLTGIANVNPASADPNEALRMIFDPKVALGLGSSTSDSTQSSANVSIASSATAPRPKTNAAVHPASQGRKGAAGQLLAFVPEDVSRRDIEHVFCLPLVAVAEVISNRQNLNQTITSDVFDGFILWRSVPVPVVRLGAIFGIASDQDQETATASGRRLVIVRASNNRFLGFYTKPQMQSMKIPTSTPGHIKSMEGRPCLGTFKTEFAAMVVPDMNRILDNVLMLD